MAKEKKRIAVLGAGGFIGHALVRRLVKEGNWVRGVDQKRPEFGKTEAQEFVVGDLRDVEVVNQVVDKSIDEVYQLAADMGGAAFIFTGDNDAAIMHNSALINLHVVNRCREVGIKKVLYTSSACIYPAYNQEDPNNPVCSEASAYPAAPDSEYGWEKLFSERIYLAHKRNFKLNVRVARLHNIFGEQSTWQGGREKAPAAICRKVAETPAGGTIEIWGDGKQTRSFLYIDECLEGIQRLMNGSFEGPLNIGSTEMITIGDLTKMVIAISGKKLNIKYVPGPLGVRGRNSDNTLIEEKLKWKPSTSLRDGMEKLYRWVAEQVEKERGTAQPKKRAA